MEAPENYVAGLGRGATGFTTRSDLGPAREGPSEEQMKEMLAKRAAAIGQPAPSAYGVTEKKDDDEDDRYQDPEDDTGLFSSGAWDRDDDEAEAIWNQVDEKMDRRRKARREEREKKEREDYEAKNPKIQQQFADLKRALGSVTEEAWANLPEVGDMTGKTKRAREARQNNRFYAVPDSVIASSAASGQLDTSIAPDSSDGTMTNFASIGEAQKSALQVRLDSAAANTSGADSLSGTATNVDKRGYLTSLEKTALKGEVPVEDIKKARLLLESAVKTNLRNGPAHVALCRLEEVAGKLGTARKVIARGCELCPHSIDCWEENIRINSENIQNAKIIAAQAIKLNPRAVSLWASACKLESTASARKRVLRQALDHNPQSIQLWKDLVNETENAEEALLLLARAVEAVPLSEELWLAYSRLCPPDKAQAVLNAARKAIPTSSAVWVFAARLQEQLGNGNMIDRIMERAAKSLAKENAMLKREDWVHEAEKCEEDGAVLTCGAIIRATLAWGLDEDEDLKDIIMKDARDSIGRGKYETARAIYAYGIRLFNQSKSLYQAAAELEKQHGTTESLLQILEKATDACPSAESLWLLRAREIWNTGDQDGARTVLALAFRQSSNENIYLKAVELEVNVQKYDLARQLLAQARAQAGTDRVYMKSAVLERNLGKLDDALDFVNQGLQLYPTKWKLHCMKGQIYEALSKLPEAQEAYQTGTRQCPKAIQLYVLLARLRERQGALVQARSTLDRGQLANPKSDVLLCENVRLERRAGQVQAAQNKMARALQECPTSGLLWAEKIMHLEARTQRKPRALEAIKKVDNDPILFITVARIFWGERRLEKAATWFEKALVLDADLGDSWAWYYKFLEQHGTEEKKAEVLSKINLTEPKHGEVWQQVAKDPKNAGKSLEEILRITVTKLE